MICCSVMRFQIVNVGDVLRRALLFEVEGQRKKGRLKRTWKRDVE